MRDAMRMMGGHPSADGHHSRRGVIQIDYATYGSEFASCDFTRQLGQRADGQKKYTFRAGNDWCGDPSPGNFKVAHIDYFCGHRDSRHAEARAGMSATLSCN
jgi:hypothetical protein